MRGSREAEKERRGLVCDDYKCVAKAGKTAGIPRGTACQNRRPSNNNCTRVPRKERHSESASYHCSGLGMCGTTERKHGVRLIRRLSTRSVENPTEEPEIGSGKAVVAKRGWRISYVDRCCDAVGRIAHRRVP
jgi:hypothetical protein